MQIQTLGIYSPSNNNDQIENNRNRSRNLGNRYRFSSNNNNYNGDRNFQQDNPRAAEQSINYRSSNMHEKSNGSYHRPLTTIQKNSTG